MFALTYAQARTDFLAAACAAGAVLHTDLHPGTGRHGEVLALDIAVAGDAAAPKRLLVSSACHGVEGYCGSGIQIAALQDAGFLAQAQAADVTLIFAHALNPYGFSFRRRATVENVDLNRNFVDFSQPLPECEGYAEIHALLFPEDWPPHAANQAALSAMIAAKGMPYMQRVVSGGQYTHPDGIYFGGHAPTWSHLALRRLLHTHCASAQSLGWIDLHTGLGPSGHGERIHSVNLNPNATADDHVRATLWWGGNGKTSLTSVLDGSSSSAELTGTMAAATVEECPNVAVTKITMEYGTQGLLQVLHAMRADQWNELHPQAPAALREANSQLMMNAFFTHTPEWQAQVLAQGLEAMAQGVAGLSAR